MTAGWPLLVRWRAPLVGAGDNFGKGRGLERNDEGRCIPLNDPLDQAITILHWPLSPLTLLRRHPFDFSLAPFQTHQNAGVHKAIAARGRSPATACPEELQLVLLPLCRHHPEPSHQRRHQGPLPGLHRQAGNVSVACPSVSFVLRPPCGAYRGSQFSTWRKTRGCSQKSRLTATTITDSTRNKRSIMVNLPRAQRGLSRQHRANMESNTRDLFRHQGCWRHKPQEGRPNASRPPCLRQRQRRREGDGR